MSNQWLTTKTTKQRLQWLHVTQNTDLTEFVQETKTINNNKLWQRREEREILFPERLYDLKWPVYNKKL